MGGATATAPGDEDAICAINSYPDNWTVLMDSWNYKSLLGMSSHVWDEISKDDNDVPGVNSPTKVRSPSYISEFNTSSEFFFHLLP